MDSLFELLLKVKGSSTDILKAMKEASVIAFSADVLMLEGLIEGCKEHLRETSGTLDAEALRQIQNNLRMLVAFRNFKKEVDPILSKSCADYQERQLKVARAMRGLQT